MAQPIDPSDFEAEEAAKAEPKDTKEKFLTRGFRAELGKPLNCSWDQLGCTLRTQRAVMGQLVQAAADAVVACQVAGAEAVKQKLAPEAKAVKASGLAYQAVLRELERIREGKWNENQVAALNIAGSTMASISSRAFSEYNAWRSAQYRKREHGKGKKGRAAYGAKQPIMLPKVSWSLRAEDKSYVLSLKLVSAGQMEVTLKGSRGWHWEMLKKLAEGTIRRHDCKLIYDERRKKWFAILTVSEPAPKTPENCDPDNVLVIHRGKHNLLTVMSMNGHWNRIARGRKLLDMKRRIKGRRRDSKMISNCERGSGAKGHGSDRRYELSDSLSEYEKRYLTTLCQQVSSQAIRLAKAWGSGTICIEDYGGIDVSDDRDERRFVERFPNYLLKQCVVWAAKKAGLEVITAPAEYISSICPACGNKDTTQHGRHGVFHCKNCPFVGEADFVAPLHMLRHVCGNGGEHDRRLEQHRKLAQAALKAEESGVQAGDVTVPATDDDSPKPKKTKKRRR